MSIITAFPAVPSRLFSIFAAAYESEDGENCEQLEAYSTPPSLSKRGASDEEESGSTLFAAAYKEARRLRILGEEDGRIRALAPASGSKKTKRLEAEKAFRSAITTVLFDPESAREAEHEAFMFAICWLLTKTPLEPIEFSQPPQEMLRRDLGDNSDKTELTNRARFHNFLYWARYLGFACFIGSETGIKVIPDPTNAIQLALPQIFGEEQAIDIEPFLTALNKLYPVFEGGILWAEVESMRTQPSSSDDILSIATSFALRRLAERGLFTFEAVADARGRILQFGLNTERVSRLRRGSIQS